MSGAEVAGLVLGVVTTWKTCIEVFDVVGSSRLYGLDYEICRVKLEVERVRLLAWGDAVGLSEVDRGHPSPDARLNRDQTRQLVMRVLGCIQRIFENSDGLQDRYGLIQEVNRPALTMTEQTGTSLPLIFRKAYLNLKRTGRERQQASTLRQKTSWAIHDKTKFQRMVTEIRQFNDSLADLFPDLKIREAMRIEIDQSVEIRPLTLLQEASADDHFDISDTASNRLEVLGATATSRSILSRDEDGRTVSEHPGARPPAAATAATATAAAPPRVTAETEQDGGSEWEDVEGGDDATVVDELEKKFQAVEIFATKKAEGALSVSMMGPYSYSAKVTAFVGWEGRNRDRHSRFWDDKDKGFVKTRHASFEAYRKRKYVKRQQLDDYDRDDDEDYVLLDPESSPKFENINPGTISIEGYANEAWNYEEEFGRQRDSTIFVSTAKVPGIQAKRLLRRLDELKRDPGRLGWSPDQDDLDLEDFLFTGSTWINPTYAKDRTRWIGDLYSALNRRDIYTDLTTTSSVTIEWTQERNTGDGGNGLWNFLWQLILARELSRRMENFPDASITGFTPRILAAIIIADLWMQNCEIILKPLRIPDSEVKEPKTPEDKTKAEDFKEQGNKALAGKKYQEAVDLYTKAIELDSSSAIYRNNRSAALFSLEKYEEAHQDAWIATELDGKYAKAWARLGAASMKLNDLEASIEAYKIAIQIAGKDVTPTMKQGLEDTKKKIKEEQDIFDNEKDLKKKQAMRCEILDAPWELRCKSPEFHSHVHERQVEGLLLFAEKMKWPYLNELRDYAEDVYANLRGGAIIPSHLADWIFGLCLPGKWFSFKIMTALVLCSPSITEKVGIAHYYECGLVLQKQSYWRIRTVLARILGALPNAQSLCGWIGPCPPVEFSPPLPGAFKPRHIRLKARRVAPTKPVPDDGVIHLGGRYDRYTDTRPTGEEDLPAYIAEMTSDDSYIIPEPPIKQISTVTLTTIKVKKLPLDISISRKRGLTRDDDVEKEAEFRASVVFQVDNNEDPVTYTLYTNPLFVTPPPCFAGPKGSHEVQLRELKRFNQEPWTVERLKDHVPDDEEEGNIMVINATGKGADVLARAWCSERGKNAVIRRQKGPCYVCAIRCASMLDVGVLIWVG